MSESENMLRTSSKESDRKHAEEETAHYMKAVHNLELKLKIRNRWQPDSEEFKSIEKKLEFCLEFMTDSFIRHAIQSLQIVTSLDIL